MNAKWITMRNPACSFWKHEKYDKQRALQEYRAQGTMHGSYYFRKIFSVRSAVAKATLKICGLGFYEVQINGKKPDETRVLSPVVSDYFRLCRLDVYDIAPLLTDGDNRISVEICDGWFSPEPKYWGWQHARYGDSRLIAWIEVSFADGTTQTTVTDESWEWSFGTVLHSNIYDGEVVDFNRVATEKDWHPAVEAAAPTENLRPTEAPPIRICRILTPYRFTRLSDTEQIYDFGENGAAIPVVTVRGQKGATVTLRHAEFLREDGSMDYSSQNRAESTDTFILSDGECICRPRFTWHGYRYLLVTCSDPKTEIRSVQSEIIHSDLVETGFFECDDPRLNQLHAVCKRTQLACLLGVPVDCPQRDERKAWLGDAHATSEICFYNFDMRDFYRSWLEDIRLDCEENGTAPFICPGSDQRRGDLEGKETSLDWSMAYPIVLSEYTKRYLDTPLLNAHLPTLRRHIACYAALAQDGILPDGWFGDWFTLDFPNGTAKVAFEAGTAEHRQNPTFAATMFFCKTVRLVREMALLCGEAEYAEELAQLWKKCQAALYDRFYHRETGKYGSGGQFLSAFALAEHLVHYEDEPQVFRELLASIEATDFHPVVGVIGMRVMFDVLTDFGHPDAAYRVLTAEGYPGLFDMISHGRTTLPEAQDGSGSGCHCMFAAPDAQLYRLLGGIDIDRTQAVPIRIRPFFPEKQNRVCCSQLLPEGKLCVVWNRLDGAIQLEIEVPPSLQAKLILPDGRTELLSAGNHLKILEE